MWCRKACGFESHQPDKVQRVFLFLMDSPNWLGRLAKGQKVAGSSPASIACYTSHYFCPGGTVADCAGFVNRNHREFESHPGLNRKVFTK